VVEELDYFTEVVEELVVIENLPVQHQDLIQFHL
jgi:hypothetical protein